MTNKELENRLIKFSVSVISMAESLPSSRTGNYLSGQIIRSGTSPALNYGEAQEAESTKDFIHKLKIIVKELRETNITLRIITDLKIANNKFDLESIRDENHQLLSIFIASIKTARKKINKS